MSGSPGLARQQQTDLGEVPREKTNQGLCPRDVTGPRTQVVPCYGSIVRDGTITDTSMGQCHQVADDTVPDPEDKDGKSEDREAVEKRDREKEKEGEGEAPENQGNGGGKKREGG